MIVSLLKVVYSMSSEYIEIPLNSNNEFKTDVSLSIGSLGINNIDNVTVKIDCGCPHSTLPLRRLGLSKDLAYLQKIQDCTNTNITKEISFGVNDTNEHISNALKLFKSGDWMHLKEITFIHRDFSVYFNDEFCIHNSNIRVSYDRTGNILIGMDILKHLDCHIGKTSSGNTIFIACPDNNLTHNYLTRLHQLTHTSHIN